MITFSRMRFQFMTRVEHRITKEQEKGKNKKTRERERRRRFFFERRRNLRVRGRTRAKSAAAYGTIVGRAPRATAAFRRSRPPAGRRRRPAFPALLRNAHRGFRDGNPGQRGGGALRRLCAQLLFYLAGAVASAGHGASRGFREAGDDGAVYEPLGAHFWDAWALGRSAGRRARRACTGSLQPL